MSIIDAMYVAYNLCACPGVAMHDMFSVATEASLCKRRCMHVAPCQRQSRYVMTRMLKLCVPSQEKTCSLL